MRGTTPTLTITINTSDFLLTSVTAIELCIENTRLTKYTREDLTIDTDTNRVMKVFTEQETTRLNPKKPLVVQGRFWLAGGAVIGIDPIPFAVADMNGI